MKDIRRALELKSELDALRPISKENELRIMQKFRLDWNYHSNHLEGNALTYGETKALILHGITAQGKPLKDHFEVTGHNEAIEYVMDVVKKNRPLNQSFIRELHTLILKNPYEVDAITPDGEPTKKRVEIGRYKTTPNHVRTKTGEIFRFATPEETPALMKDLMNWYEGQIEKSDFNPILSAAEFHYRFVRIHPFDDGNGRMARILMNFILLMSDFPPVVIKTEDKENYYSALQQADAGILEPFVDYITKNLIRSLEIMIKGAKGERIDEPDDLDKKIYLLEQKFKSISRANKIERNKEAILKVFDSSCRPLFERFLEKSDKFNQFYDETEYYFLIYGYSINSLEEVRNRIKDDTTDISLSYSYNNLKISGHEDEGYYHRIEFRFGLTEYSVNPNIGKKYTRLYSEQLTEDEIKDIVSAIIERHIGEISEYMKSSNDSE